MASGKAGAVHGTFFHPDQVKAIRIEILKQDRDDDKWRAPR
jgi:hypothetical protein